MQRRSWALLVGMGMVVSLASVVPTATAAEKKRPDLVVSALSTSSAQVKAGTVFRIRDTTRNRGRKAAPKSITRYVLSTNKRLDKSDVRLRDRKVKKLKPGARHSSPWQKVSVPSHTLPGRYWLLACADARGKVRESDERNNCRAARTRLAVVAGQPTNGAVEVNVSAKIDVKYRLRADSPGFWHQEDSNVRLDGTGTGWLTYLNGKPAMLSWVWSRATVSGTAKWNGAGQTNTPCPWTAAASVTRSGSVVDVHPMGSAFSGTVSFPGQPTGASAEFALNHVVTTVPIPRTDCHGPTEDVSPPLKLELRTHWWGSKPAYTVALSPTGSTLTWREHDTSNYRSLNGETTENQSYQADGTLQLTPVTPSAR